MRVLSVPQFAMPTRTARLKLYVQKYLQSLMIWMVQPESRTELKRSEIKAKTRGSEELIKEKEG